MLDIVLKTAKAAQFAHTQNCYNLDLCLDNILYNPLTNQIVLRDTGFTLAPEDMGNELVSNENVPPIYRAFETITENKINQYSDAYSFGMLMYVLFYAPNESEETVYNLADGQWNAKIQKGWRPVFRNMKELTKPETKLELNMLMSQCWSKNVLTRPNFQKIVYDLRNIL